MHNEKFLRLNQMSNFKHGSDNAKACNCQVAITFNKMFSSKIDLLLYQTEIISLLLSGIGLAQGRNEFYISFSFLHFEILLCSLSMTLVFLVTLRKLLIPGYLPCSKGG